MTLDDELVRLLMELPPAEIPVPPLRIRPPRIRAYPPPWVSEPLSDEGVAWLIAELVRS